MPRQVPDDPAQGDIEEPTDAVHAGRGRHPSPDEVAASYRRLAAVRDPLERRFALLREARRLGIEVGDLEALLADYALAQRTRRGTLERWLYPLARRFEERSIFEILEYVGRLAILFAILSFFIGLPERRAQQRANRWEAVQAAAGEAYDSDRVASLQLLARRCFPMQGLMAPGAELARLALDGCHRLPGGLTVGGGLLGRYLPFLYRYQGADLRGADFTAANLEGARLRGADLRDAHLAGARLAGADLRGADLNGADLSDTDLVRADLAGADLFGADLTGADLFRAELDDATLHLARLCGASFVGSRLRRAEFDHAEGCPAVAGAEPAATLPPSPASPTPAFSTSFSATPPQTAPLPGVPDLPGPVPDVSTAPGVNFSAADLSGAQFFAADLRGARFHRARLDRQTAFDRADLTGVHIDATAGGDHGSEAAPRLRLAFVKPDSEYFFSEVKGGVDRAAGEFEGLVEVTVHDLSRAAGSPALSPLDEIRRGADVALLRMTGLDQDEVLELRDIGVVLACYDQCPETAWGGSVFVVSTETAGDRLGAAGGELMRRWWSRRQRSLPRRLPLLILRSCLGEGCFRRVRGLREDLATFEPASRGSLREAAYRVADGEDLYPAACDLVRRHRGPAVLWAANERGTEAAVEAVHALGRQGEIRVFGVDRSPALAAMLTTADGALQGVVSQDPGEMGYVAASRALAAALHQPVPYERVLTGHHSWARHGMGRADRRAARELAAQADPAAFPAAPPRPCPPR